MRTFIENGSNIVPGKLQSSLHQVLSCDIQYLLLMEIKICFPMNIFAALFTPVAIYIIRPFYDCSSSLDAKH